MKIQSESFRGEAPRVTPRALPDNAAQDATNARLLTGDVNAWNQFATTKALANTGPVQTISLMAGQYWLSWDEEVDVARGIIPGDTTYRTYLTGLDVPRFTNLSLATTGAEPFPVQTRPLGVPGPESAPTVALGVDPNPTSFSIDTLDEGDQFTDSWTANGPVSGGGAYATVEQNNSLGNPAPSYMTTFDENPPGGEAWAYRDFGVAGVTVLTVSVDVMFPSIGDTSFLQASITVGATNAGAGVGLVWEQGGLSIRKTSGWGARFNSAGLIGIPVTGGMAVDVWHRMELTVVLNSDGTKKVTGNIYTGSVHRATITATNNFDDGDFCGFANSSASDASSRFYTLYDNYHVQASGSTGYVPTTTATSYVYTFVNDLGEESAPSFASATVIKPDGVSATVTSATAIPSGVSSEYGITTKRIYRAATGATGTVFRFVAEIPLAQADYVDTIPDTELGETLESTDWDLPPDDLRGVLALPNGVMAGFRRNQLCLSAPNRPHAWPVSYRLNTDTDIVGIGNIDTTVVIGTKSFVYLAGGTDPALYSMSKLEVPQACVSKRSIAYLTGIGVVFASPDGLIAVAGTGQIRNLTETIFTREQWQALEPETIIGVAHDDIYHFFYENSTPGGFALDMKQSGFGLIPLAYHAIASHADPVTDNLYLVLDADNEPTDNLLPLPSTAPSGSVLNGTTIVQFDGDDASKMVYRWKSKLYILPYPTSFFIAQVKAHSYTNTVIRVYKQTYSEVYGVWQDILIRELAVTSEEEFPLTVNTDYTRVWWEVLSTDRIQSVQIVQDVNELT